MNFSPFYNSFIFLFHKLKSCLIQERLEFIVTFNCSILKGGKRERKEKKKEKEKKAIT